MGLLIAFAFIIEAISVKISAKESGNLPILMISEARTRKRFELPIWPDLYEEKKLCYYLKISSYMQ